MNESSTPCSDTGIAGCVDQALTQYFERLEGFPPGNLHGMMLAEVERILIRRVLEHANGNQRAAAEILGINRATLRKKARAHGLITTDTTVRR
ncbi:MAG: helix-turn-helix domain-containing protein [Pseudomonadota bacterium]